MKVIINDLLSSKLNEFNKVLNDYCKNNNLVVNLIINDLLEIEYDLQFPADELDKLLSFVNTELGYNNIKLSKFFKTDEYLILSY